MMKYLSICSGIEAATVAWEPLGWTAAAYAEIDKFPRAVLEHHYPDVPLHGDFTTIGADDYEPIDLLVGGTPCQSFSVAGLRGGLDDDRGNLALQYCKLADRLKPRWCVWENVPGVLSSNGGRDFGSILGALGELGYGCAFRVFDAQYFGVPQRRRRVFVVGYLGDWRRAAAVLFERESLCRNPPPRREKGTGVAGTLEARASTGGFDPGAHGAASGYLQPVAYGGNNTSGPIEVSTTLNACGTAAGRQDFETETFVADHAPALSASNPYGDHESREGLLVAHTLSARYDSSEDGCGRGVPLVPDTSPTLVSEGDGHSGFRDERGLIAFDTTQITSAANRSNPKPGDPCHPMAAAAHPPAIAFQERGRKDGREVDIGGNIAYALTSPADGGRSQERNILTPDMAVRRLTPRECERLQGFPDDYTKVPYRGKEPEACADGPRYKALGNSMAVPVMRWIGERIELADALGVA